MYLHPAPGAVLQGILSDIPHDTAAIVAYVILALFVGFIVVGGRRKHGDHDASVDAGSSRARAEKH